MKISLRIADKLVNVFSFFLAERVALLRVAESDNEANRAVNHQAQPLEMVIEQLREEDNAGAGALVCEFDFFRVLYNSMARMALRSGDAIHIGQISIVPKDGKQLSRRLAHAFHFTGQRFRRRIQPLKRQSLPFKS